MKKSMFLVLFLWAVLLLPVFGQETYTLLYSGDVQGTITIQQDQSKKITIAGRVIGGGFTPILGITHALCPLIPTQEELVFRGSTRSIIIDGNTTTTTNLDGSWMKRTVNGNTTTITYSNGNWEKSVVNGNTTIKTSSDGRWEKIFVNGNITTTTFSSGLGLEEVVNGNTTITTFSFGYWSKKVVNGNITTITRSSGSWEQTVVDKQGYNIFITTTGGE